MLTLHFFLRETLESNFKGQNVFFATADGGVSCVNGSENQVST